MSGIQRVAGNTYNDWFRIKFLAVIVCGNKLSQVLTDMIE